MVKKTFNFIVVGGKATGGPPIGPSLGPLGVNIMAVVNKINEVTSAYEGMKVPVEVTLDTDTKEFSVKVGMLSTYSLILQALGISKGSSTPKRSTAGNLTFKQVVEIAKRKRRGLLANSLKASVKEVLGTCLSMGVTVEGKNVKEFMPLLESGIYDEFLKETP